MIERKRNRRLSRNPKRGMYWCNKCDRDKVSSGGKCGTCGHPTERRSFKKALGTEKHLI